MGFFSKLFGFDTKRKDFQASVELMDENTFWEIIEKSYRMAKGDYKQQQIALHKLLSKKTPQEIIIFENRFCQLREKANTWRLWGAVYLVNGGCSDDSFHYCKAWLIAQGRTIYNMVVNDPNTIVNINKNSRDEEWEGIEYIATQVFEEMTNEEIPSEYIEKHEPSGVEWDEVGNDLEKMFPELWAKYGLDKEEL
jgi:Protein of unknown function (DUF4240)